MNKPLYVKYREGIYEKKEELDKASFLWLKKELNSSEIYLKDIGKNFKPIKEQDFRKFIPKRRWFKKNPLIGIHGLSHILRVMVYTYILCQKSGENRIEPFMVAASIHDLRRSVDMKEDNHGLNASKWFLKNKSLFKELSNKEIRSIVFAVSHHDIYSDEKILDEEGVKLFNILKAADALDRFRLPKKEWWPNQKFISIKLSNKFLEFAKNFVIQTEKDRLAGKGVIEAIIRNGKKYGVIEN